MLHNIENLGCPCAVMLLNSALFSLEQDGYKLPFLSSTIPLIRASQKLSVLYIANIPHLPLVHKCYTNRYVDMKLIKPKCSWYQRTGRESNVGAIPLS